jgi:hypothetical protein
MKKINALLLLMGYLMITFSYLNAQTVSIGEAQTVAVSFVNVYAAGSAVEKIEPVTNDDLHLAYVGRLLPKGFVLIANSKLLDPVVAYSFESNWTFGCEEEVIFKTLLYADLKNRLDYPDLTPEHISRSSEKWAMLLSGNHARSRFEQWPPEGTTPTGGWLLENWTQNAPYNTMCPIDPNTHQRGLAGCPAVAMAQILNCIKDIKGTRLDDSDDYYHNFGVNNKYWIDDDWRDFGFPHFDSLNIYLDTLEYNYSQQKPINAEQKAALNFACGVALKQVYSSSISGTYGMTQAGAAYLRFGFDDSRLVMYPDTIENENLAENIKNGWPAHLGLVDPAHTVGHNVVVDGYNTDDFFHFNFGWGGSANGWYTMPPVSIPYNLTVIEGIVLDIFGDNPPVSDFAMERKTEFTTISYVAEQNLLVVLFDNPETGYMEVDLFDISGQQLSHNSIATHSHQSRYEMHIPKVKKGFAIVRLTINNKSHHSKKIVIL